MGLFISDHTGGASYRRGTPIILQALVRPARLAEDVDVTVELEIPVCPARAEEHDHPKVYEKVKDEVDGGHHQKPSYGVDQKRDEGDQREVAEPHDVAHRQDDVEIECRGTDLYHVDLSHLVEQVEQDEEPIDEVDGSRPALVAVIRADGQRVNLL